MSCYRKAGKNLTSTQIANIRDTFRLFDKDGDGTINSRDLGRIIRALGKDPTESQLTDIINEMDKNGNGTVEFNEFFETMSKMLQDSNLEENTRQAFRVFDKNDRGYITEVDIRKVMRDLGENVSESDIQTMLQEADKNGDGKVTYEEFKEMMNEKN